ncbi:MAG: ATP-binding cassette domain-containing protein, partial [Acidiferrobacterales bacterium]
RIDGRARVQQDLELVYSYFPKLKERRHGQAGYISGGEQQMTALGRALMSRPRMILLDEPSMGLAPQLVGEIFDIVKRGVIQVMEGRRCFEHLTVEENLLTGAHARTDGRDRVAQDLEMVYSYFPRLKERRTGQAGYISGGEQQMTALGRALMSRPRMILLDEPSMGLAPQLVGEIFDIVKRLNESENVSFLLAEQNTNMALHYAQYGYILENGRVVLDGEAKDLAENEDVKEFYLGVSGERRKSFRDFKHYRRRKRWLA